MYMVGQTGTGKSTLLHQMIMQDIHNGEGVCVIDPHGELVDDVLACIPEHRADDVVYIDPTDPDTAVGLNLLDYRDTLDRDSAINHLLEIFDQLYDMRVAGGPIFEQYLRNSAHLATGCGRNKATLADIGRVFVDRTYRIEQLEKCTDPLVRSFWINIATKIKSDNWSLTDMAAYVTSKLSRIIYNGLMRPIVLQRESTVDLLECMNKRRIVLIDLAKGKLGETNARFLGMILLSLITRAAFSRSEFGNPKTLPDFYLYVDEFQNLATDSFSAILSEARKYRLNLIISNQYLHQIPQDLQDAVLGNAGTVLSFRVGLQDAELLERRYSNGVSQFDLMSLSNFNAYLTTLLHGEASSVFDIKTRRFDGAAKEATAERIRKTSAERYARPRAEIDAEIAKTLKKLRSP